MPPRASIRDRTDTRDPFRTERWMREVANILNGRSPFSNALLLGGGFLATGPVKFVHTLVTATPHQAVAADVVLLVDTDVAITIALPPIATAGVMVIKDEQGAGAAVNNVILNPSGAELIDGALTYTLNVTRGSVTIFPGPTQWSII